MALKAPKQKIFADAVEKLSYAFVSMGGRLAWGVHYPGTSTGRLAKKMPEVRPFPFRNLHESAAPTSEDVSRPERPANLEEEGRAAGFSAGFEEGTAQGYREGLERGLTEGREAGRADGFQRGFEEGRAQGLGQANGEVAVLRTLVAQLDGLHEAIEKEVEQAAVTFALDLARCVLRREISSGSERHIRDAVGKILTEIPLAPSSVEIHMHPEDAGKVTGWIEAGAPLRIVPDPAVSQGGIVIRGATLGGEDLAGIPPAFAFSEWDAAVETRWTTVLAALLGQD